VSNIGVSFDEKFADQYPDTDATREHPHLVHVTVSRGEDVLHQEVLAEGGVVNFSPPFEIDGGNGVTVRSAMESGPRGPSRKDSRSPGNWSSTSPAPREHRASRPHNLAFRTFRLAQV
jgi:hypothetical protein